MLPDNILDNLFFDTTGLGCWLYLGRLNRNGYGYVWHEGRDQVAHRVTYSILCGPIPDGKILDHRCRVRRCANPFHAEPVTHSVNTRRGDAVLFGDVI